MSHASISKRCGEEIVSLTLCPTFVSTLKSRELSGAQKSDEWLKQRDCMITASDAAAALGENPYSSKEEFVDRKCANTFGAFTGNAATLWGEQWEDVALQKYCDRLHKTVYQLNLVRHRSISWLGGSPDGVTSDGILVEIKCPPNRKIKPGYAGVPVYYIHQVQMLMYILELDSCHFVQYKPYMGEFAPEILEVVEIQKDPQWWATNFVKLQSVWETITHRRELISKGDFQQAENICSDASIQTTTRPPKRVKPSPLQSMPCIISDN